MLSPLRRLLTAGIRTGDDEQTRLRTALLLVAAAVVTPLAVVWGAIYWVGSAHGAAAIPGIYAVISLATVGTFLATHSYRALAIGQFVPYVLLPFALMWALGGFVAGSGVALWAALGPILALLLGHRRSALALSALYAAMMVASVAVPAPSTPAVPAALRQALFAMNLAGVPLLAWLLIRVFSGDREDTLDRVRGVVRRYLAADLAAVILADPRRAELGGVTAEVTVLFADLGGYSTYSEHRSPTAVMELLNRYFAIAIPAILAEGGVPTQLPGDAVVAVFGAPHAQPDHASRACRAALAILHGTESLAAGAEQGPRFHIGLNSGPALVGNIGSEEYRNFTAIGDTTNIAARLQALARPGEIVVGPLTASFLEGSIPLSGLGHVKVKGRQQPVEAFSLAPRDDTDGAAAAPGPGGAPTSNEPRSMG